VARYASRLALVDRKPNAACEEIASQVFRGLVQLDSNNPLRFRFDPDAQQLFVEWLADLESKLRSGELHPALVSHLSKYRKLMPALALLFELADRAAGGFEGFVGANPGESQNFWVSLEHAKQAGAWCEYLESHARRVYSFVTTSRMRAARELADKIKQRKVGANGSFTCRDVYLKGWSGLAEPEAVKLAFDVLLDAGWVKELGGESGASGGRPSTRYAINPGVWR
jgi:putative DNA primase/helicase